MKLIFSRKGFDSSAGGVASPILPSGRLCSLPIPGKGGDIRYGQIEVADTTAGTITHDLTHGAITPADSAHLDPDLDEAALSRRRKWRPLFGQAGAAQGHLRNQGVRAGDLFLFYGWFRRVEYRQGKYRYVPDAPDLHVLFGWLQVDRIIKVGDERAPAWARYHPHFQTPERPNNTVYVARSQLSLPGAHPPLPGAGIFSTYCSNLCLTCPGESRSIWRLPAWFHPHNRASTLTYHSSRDRWHRNETCVRLKTAPRGQEFVLDCTEYPEAIPWVRELLGEAGA